MTDDSPVRVTSVRLPFGEVLVLVVQVGLAAGLVGVIVGAALYLLGLWPRG